uniref:Dipeptidylpeptidase IV N-terminal domain-containing protein n=1 Tax=Oncorhynchus tshawytscha TaxID=74940 RepID=A0A8C8BWW2_ONCTS
IISSRHSQKRTGHPSEPGSSLGFSLGSYRNWKGIAISLLVIMVILSLIGLAIVLLSKSKFLEVLSLSLFPITLSPSLSLTDEEIIFRSWDGDVFKANTQSNETDLLLKNTTFATFKASKFAVSPDLNFVLLGYDVKQVYRYSFLASYLIYNLHTREVQELNPPEVSDSVLQFASWGVRDQQLVYVFENNIYYQTDVKSSSWRLTSSGQEGVVFNGIADWLYEEEVLHSQVAHWWSPDGSRLAYLNLNDTLVPNMLLPRFTGTLYPRGQLYPYPKVGQVNPTVKLYVVTLDGGSQTTELRPPNSFEKRYDYYITMVKWVTKEKIGVRWLNRAQNTSILTLCEVTMGACLKKHVITSEKWLDRQNEEPLFSKDGNTFFLTMPIKHGGRGSFHHITMISDQFNGDEVNMRHLTSGSWEVSQILEYDEEGPSSQVNLTLTSCRIVFSRLLSIRVSAVNPFQRECLTCSLFKTQCSYYDAVFNQDYQYVLLNCRGNSSIKIIIVMTSKTLEHTPVVFITTRKYDIPMSTEHTRINPYCTLIAVSDQFVLDWDSVLVSSDNVIVARLDGSGSGFLGQRVLHEVYQRLGTVEVQDQIAAVEYLSHGYSTVHFQHSAELVKLLSISNVNYTLQIFPDEGHNIYSVKSQRYLLNSVMTFFRECFLVEIPAAHPVSEDD